MVHAGTTGTKPFGFAIVLALHQPHKLAGNIVMEPKLALSSKSILIMRMVLKTTLVYQHYPMAILSSLGLAIFDMTVFMHKFLQVMESKLALNSRSVIIILID